MRSTEMNPSHFGGSQFRSIQAPVGAFTCRAPFKYISVHQLQVLKLCTPAGAPTYVPLFFRRFHMQGTLSRHTSVQQLQALRYAPVGAPTYVHQYSAGAFTCRSP